MKTFSPKSAIAAATAAGWLFCGFCFAQFTEIGSLPQALVSHTAVVWENRVYVAGGVSDTGGARGVGGFLNNVYYCASINPDGTLGAWQVANSMPELLGLGLHASVAHNGRLYVLGGTNMFGPKDAVYHSAINADGSLAGWSRTASMPRRLTAHAAAVLNGRMYVFGGVIRSAGSHGGVYSSPVAADGTLGAWREESGLPTRLLGHQALALGGRFYIIGGSRDFSLYSPDGSPPVEVSSAVYSAAVNQDGTLGPWQILPALPEPLLLFAAAATSKNIYVAGGYNGTGASNAVYFAPLLGDGSLGSWQALGAMPRNLIAPAAVTGGEYLYALGGGLSYIDGPQAAIYSMKLNTLLKAMVRIMPATLNKSSKGKWVTAIIGLPEADARDILVATIRISAVNAQKIEPIYPDPKWTAKIHFGDSDEFGGMSGHRYVMVKFGRKAVENAVPEGDVTFRIEGSLKDGRTFSGENTNWVINSRKDSFARLMNKRDGERTSPRGVRVHVPKDAFPGNPDLLLSVEDEDETALSAQEKEKRAKGMEKKELAVVSGTVEFGPAGLKFEKPLGIAVPYDPARLPSGAAEDDLRVCYWNPAAGEWEELASVVAKEEKLVKAEVLHFSVYQVMARKTAPAALPAPSPEFVLGEVYVFPNPAKAGARPRVHIETPSGEKAQVRVYTASGRLAAEQGVSGQPSAVTDGNGTDEAYEVEIAESLPSGIYYYFAEVSKGSQKLKKAGKFAVVR